MIDVLEYMRGQAACDRGDVCPVGASKDFERGYGARYEEEQVLTNRSEK